MRLQWGHFYKGDFDKAIPLKEEILRNVEQQFSLQPCVYGFSGASFTYYFLGRWDLAIEEGKQAPRIAEEYSDNSLISFALWIISIAYTGKWDLDRAIEYGDLAIQKAPTPADKLWAQMALALAWCRAGETQRGIETLAAILPMFQAGRFRNSEMGCGLLLGEGYWLAREYDKARQTLEEALELADACGYRYHSGSAQRLLGEIALKTNPAQAAHHFNKNIAVLKEIKAENELAMAYAGYGRFHKQQGNIAEAREYLTNSLEIFERLGTLIQPDMVREELAGLPEG